MTPEVLRSFVKKLPKISRYVWMGLNYKNRSTRILSRAKSLNLLLSGTLHPLLEVWMCGAPLTALNMKMLMTLD